MDSTMITFLGRGPSSALPFASKGPSSLPEFRRVFASTSLRCQTPSVATFSCHRPQHRFLSQQASSASTLRARRPHRPTRPLATLAGLQSDDLPLDASPDTAAAAGDFFVSLYRFSRPHTMLGTFISVVSVSMLAVGSQAMTTAAAAALAQALSSALLMNICIVGINQIYDVEIDKINKPYLPLASEELTMATATSIVWTTGLVSLAIGISSSSAPLLATLGGSLLLGIAYSTELPFLRWKRYPLVAAGCILAVRAVLVQLGFFFHMQRALGGTGLQVTRPVAFATAFMLVFAIVIALFKDIPDLTGDKRAGLKTLTVRLGQKRVFWACIVLLEVAYVGAVGVSLSSEVAWKRAASAAAHAIAGALVWWRATKTDLDDSKSIYACYMDVWKFFYAEYLLLPLLS